MFKNRLNHDGTSNVVNRVPIEGEKVLIEGQVLTNHEIVRRGLYGTIVDKVVPGTFFESDYDLEKLQDADLIEKHQFMLKSKVQLGELESSVVETKKLIAEKELAEKEELKKAEEERISALIDKKKISGKE